MDLVVVLEGLVPLTLGVEGPCELVAALRPHRLVLGAVEGVEGQVLGLSPLSGGGEERSDLPVVLLEEEVVGEVVEDHGVGRVQ